MSFVETLVCICHSPPRNFCLAQTVPDEYGVGNEDGFTVGDLGYDVDLRSEMDAELEKEEQARANISRILNELIDGYDRNLRPNIRGPPVIVRSDIFVLSIGPVIEINMEFQVDMFFRQRWNDPRLKFNVTTFDELRLNTVMLETIWYPDTYFYNGKEAIKHSVTTPNRMFRISPEGNILYTSRLTVVAACMMDLRKYPMDTQVCPLSFGSNSYSEEDVIYAWKYPFPNESSAIDAADDLMLNQFNLLGWEGRSHVKVSNRIGNRTVLTVEFSLERHIGFFLIQTYFPCVMIVALSWVSFWLNREATPARVALGTMTTLTITTLGWSARAVLPKVGYPKAIDWFIMLCFAFVLGAVIEFATVNYFTKRRTGMLPGMADDEEDDIAQAEVEKVEASLMRRKKKRFSLIRGFTRYQGKSVSRTPSDEERRFSDHNNSLCSDILNCITGNAEYRESRLRRSKDQKPFNSVSKIDELARIGFPLGFFLMNVLYWCIFILDY
ncbi:gamma-aminobutyric acid receptor subunit alpha-2 [Strongylocentrotus purpuratus]|uniref:Gamma-aminobutyric acid receptor subunit beta n=2 Tax=Strongylocentrotus purpuratus TaxID=7668 RepID=A0A7M7NGH4_STRPU|nr:gamma-aminobutyric acid receptor subunit alpha-2 [Strongylocentrotus purpuratus]